MSHSFIFVRMIQVVKARAIFFGVLVFAVVLLMAGMLLPGENPSPVADMPWQIEHNANGIRVFGLTLGHSTLDEAQTAYAETAYNRFATRQEAQRKLQDENKEALSTAR